MQYHHLHQVQILLRYLSENKTYTVNVQKPNGIRDISIKTITVNLTVTKESQIEIPEVGIIHQNLDASLQVMPTSKEDAVTAVLVKGSEESLKTLDSSKVVAVIDLSKYTSPGEYEVDVKVTGEDTKLVYEPKTKKVKVVISKK